MLWIRLSALGLVILSAIELAERAAAQPAPVPGSEIANTTAPISGKQLPAPNPEFGGTIRDNVRSSKAWWPPRTVPPKGAPNVLLIMTDDSGYGVPSTFGGVIPTPALDRIAKWGLRFTQFHSTALCSPTRAALLTGRNHHSCGFGVVAEQATGFPGYDSIITRDKATIGRTLLENGYVTSWFGKDHNVPAFQASQVGPFDQWPTGQGFQYFYGFIGGDTSQWQPNLFRNTTQIYPFQDKPGWNLVTAMADDAIAWMHRMDQTDPSRPFFCYYAPGAVHAPHHATPEWIKKISDMHLFDEGWNKLRETIFANQKRLGVIPQDAKLTPWPDDLFKSWEKLNAREKKLFIRQAEVFAAYAAYADYEIGRVIQAVEDMGKLDNTLIIYINGDNGTSAEGTMTGSPNEVAFFNGVKLPVEEQLWRYYDVWGSDKTYNHMAAPWAWAFNTPFPWTKQIASHLGGIRQGMCVSWPDRIKDVGGIRGQFHHVIDVAPTILEAASIQTPEKVDGVQQSPIEGTSMLYTFAKENAAAPSTHKTQYFEIMGDHAIYHDGWLASTKVTRLPWEGFKPPNPDPLNNVTWELYDLTKDYSQADDIAAQHPDKVKEMQVLFLEEARKYQVLPLDATVIPRIVAPRPNITAGRTEFVYTRTMTGLPQASSPYLLNTSYTITAEIEVPKGKPPEGMMLTSGGRFAGYGFYLLKGKPVFLWNLLDLRRVRWEGSEVLAPGKHTLEFKFEYDGLGLETLAYSSPGGIGQGGTGRLTIDGKLAASHRMFRTLPLMLQWDESFDIGSDTLTGVNDTDYRPPFKLTARLHKLTVNLDRPQMTPEQERRLEQAQRNNHVSE